MLYVHPDLDTRREMRRREEAIRQAETWRMLHQASRSRGGWLLRQNCRLLCRLGHGLVRMGLWLQNQGSPEDSAGAGTSTALA